MPVGPPVGDPLGFPKCPKCPYVMTGPAQICFPCAYGWLEANLSAAPPDIIVANPTFVGAGGASFGHTERVVEAAEKEDVLGRWSFDVASPRAIIKVSATPKSASNSAPAKEEAAEAHRAALRIPRPGRIREKHVLIYDDVCTTGRQLDAVAAVLMDAAGAASVSAVVLARAPWRT